MFDIKRVTQKMELLEQGKTLFMEHSIYGRYMVYMNQQKNRLVTEPVDEKAKNYVKESKVTSNGIAISSDSVCSCIETFIMWDMGKWTVEVTPRKVELREVVVDEGSYDEL